jgi:hypothetical protein
LWACNNLDTNAYNALFAAGELKNQPVPDPKYKWTRIILRRMMLYGDYTILEIEVVYSGSVKNDVNLWTLRKIGQEYYASDKLELTDRAYDYLFFHYILSGPMEQKLDKVTFAENGFVYLTNNASGGNGGGFPLIFRLQGRIFPTNTIIDRWPTSQDQDLSTPAGTLASAFAALNSGDVERYSQLLDPVERTNILLIGPHEEVGRTWDSWMRLSFKEGCAIHRPSAVRLDKELVYSGQTVALLYEDANSNLGARTDILYFHKVGNQWFISHKMEDKAGGFVNYLGFNQWLGTKMFPVF